MMVKMAWFIIVALLTYLVCVGVVTFVLTTLFSAGGYLLASEWRWVWELQSTPMLFVVLICFGIANYLVEDYLKCECDPERNLSQDK